MIKFINSIIVIILITIISSSCDDYLNVNDNPNAPGSSNLGLNTKLPAALLSTIVLETGSINQVGGFWGGYWGTTNEGVNQFFSLKTYNGPTIRNQRDGIQIWENSYNNLLYYQLIREEAESAGALFYAGIAKIMQGWHFLRLVDFYNNIPFDQALQGTAFPTPEYEDGQTVYRKSVDLITEGIQDIVNAKEGTHPGNDDIIFNGSRSLWIKFGNTIKLRALIRQSETGNDDYITSEINKINAQGGGFLEEGESAMANPGYTNAQPNGFWSSYYRDLGGATTGNHQNIRPTTYLINSYLEKNDPRLPLLYQKVENTWKGVLFGNPNTSDPMYSQENTSAFLGPEENNGKPAALFKSPSQSDVLMGSFESLFLQTEAAVRGWIDGSAKSFYERAIAESCRYMEVEDSLIIDYITQDEVAYANADTPLKRIIEQKWLALNSISSIEAWNDHRRLGWPNYPGSIANGIPEGNRPLRFMYPETERSTNNDNTSLQGNDEMTISRIWWDTE